MNQIKRKSILGKPSKIKKLEIEFSKTIKGGTGATGNGFGLEYFGQPQ